ncbi:hypothetical protein D3C81_1540190 [compost metagenome]
MAVSSRAMVAFALPVNSVPVAGVPKLALAAPSEANTPAILPETSNPIVSLWLAPIWKVMDDASVPPASSLLPP